jgi:tungstate transport system substrate-binding protein
MNRTTAAAPGRSGAAPRAVLRRSAATLALAALLSAIPASGAFAAPAATKLRLATTTSTEQSGLLAAILPAFEKESGYKVDVVAVGTGAALKLGEKGDADVLLVHARAQEDAFVAAGFGVDRRDVMYNDFIVLGPQADPAGLAKTKTVLEAFAAIAKVQAPFVSRGDKSGTDVKEKDLWKAAGLASASSGPSGVWYKEAGQGMSQVIMMADGLGAYTLADRATWLAMKGKTGLAVLFQGDKSLFNPYGVIAVNPAKWPDANYAGAKALIEWLTAPRGRALIAGYAIGGEQLFYLY